MALKDGLGSYKNVLQAVLISSLAFGLAHLGNLQTQALDVTLFQVYYAMAMGIYFAAVVIRTRSLWWAIFIHFIVFHFLYNTCYNKSMAYGIDFRKRVIAYKNSGHSKQETCKV
ncbi:CPBP family intramembrane glutamic endopeptidase, partial [Streptococcus acidominimus]